MANSLSSLLSQIELLRSKAKDREEREQEKEKRLPVWPENVRAVPNGILRSALFGAIRKGRRRYLKGEYLAALDGIEIRYTGERLDQGDLDVWESVLHAVRAQALGSRCRITSYALLKLMGKTDSGKNRAALHERITRLRANAVEVRQGRYTYIGGLIDEAYKDEATQEWVIVINPTLGALFAPDQYTQVEWTTRRALSGHPLAQWLHGFYCTHAKPYPVKVETLHRLSGSENKELFSFRQELREALGALESVTGWAWQIDEQDLVHVQTRPTPSQRRHLIREKLK